MEEGRVLSAARRLESAASRVDAAAKKSPPKTQSKARRSNKPPPSTIYTQPSPEPTDEMGSGGAPTTKKGGSAKNTIEDIIESS
ncbi:MAG: hypothetical protein ACKPKO_55045, partial [Candidatus Fonsibacter sp.]